MRLKAVCKTTTIRWWPGHWLHLQGVSWIIKVTASFFLNLFCWKHQNDILNVWRWAYSKTYRKHTTQKQSTCSICTTLQLWHEGIQLSDGLIFSQFLLPRQPHHKGLDNWGHRRHSVELCATQLFGGNMQVTVRRLDGRVKTFLKYKTMKRLKQKNHTHLHRHWSIKASTWKSNDITIK